ncbi:hypothetical protein [Bradyrhizobium sp.]|uniref:hypothetical protein n=1 Tax=Bradyrhizobium sp. TaxID=376 RepID=UPI003C3AEE0D
MLTRGGTDAMSETRLMITEEVDAAFESSVNPMAAASADSVVDGYRQHVAANAERLLNWRGRCGNRKARG